MLPVAYLLALSIVGETGVHAPARHGVFIVQGDTQIELAAQDVVQRNLVGYMTRILIGLEDRQTEDLPVVSESTTAICFGQLQSPSDWRVTRLAYSERYEDALIRRDPFNVNIWLPDEEVACDVKVTPGESDCYVLCPKSHLKPGLYCIHCCSLEPLTYVGTVDRQVFAFIVKEARKGRRLVTKASRCTVCSSRAQTLRAAILDRTPGCSMGAQTMSVLFPIHCLGMESRVFLSTRKIPTAL